MARRITETLPDEILLKILQIGVQKSILSCRDISSVSLSCKILEKLSEEDTLWSTLLTLDFPSASSQPNNNNNTSIPSSSSKRSHYKFVLKCNLQLKIVRVERRLERREDRLRLLARKIKRLGRELRFIDVQMKENSGELLDMIQDRYVICHGELAKVKKKYTHVQNKVASTLAEFIEVDHRLRALSCVCDGKVPSNDEANSSEDSEDISEVESERSS